ncbi:hypothetical protein PENTCL1PPCAC_15567, partial [Pristionchus entomophagus]
MHNETFTYRFDLDRDYFIDFSLRFQSILPFFTLITIRPLILLILMKKRDYMGADIRWGYILSQIAMMAQEFNFCFLFRIHDLSPYAGLYCDGPICRMGIVKQYLMIAKQVILHGEGLRKTVDPQMLLSASTIGTVPAFLFLLVRMHQRIIENTRSRLKLSAR